MSARYPVHDGLALTSAEHPIGTAVDEDADIDPGAVEMIEVDLPEELFDQAIVDAAVEWLAARDALGELDESTAYELLDAMDAADNRLTAAVRAKQKDTP